MAQPTLGILTGVSYVSGLDYFKCINEQVLAATPKCHIMSPKPSIVMVSVDCDEYVHYLTLKSFEKVDEHLLAGFVVDVHPHIRAGTPHQEMMTELRILKSIGMHLLVLFPQQLKRHPRSPQLGYKIREVPTEIPIARIRFVS